MNTFREISHYCSYYNLNIASDEDEVLNNIPHEKTLKRYFEHDIEKKGFKFEF